MLHSFNSSLLRGSVTQGLKLTQKSQIFCESNIFEIQSDDEKSANS